MSMIFPGMDPYLENRALWLGVHNSLIVYIRDLLQPQLLPRYLATLEVRLILQTPPKRRALPDVGVERTSSDQRRAATAVLEADAPVTVRATDLEIKESVIHIIDRTSRNRLVTVIEVLSPTNKYAGPGRKLFLAKQKRILNSRTHLVEIDLLRAGPHVLAVPENDAADFGPYDYIVSVNRAIGHRDEFELYPRTVRERLPRIRIPLVDPDPDVVLDLQAAVTQTYEAGAYRNLLRYDRPCVPLLRPGDQAWADELIPQALNPPPPRPRKRSH
jgi:hypothetical protein